MNCNCQYSFIKGTNICRIEELSCHEEIMSLQVEALIGYLRSLGSTVIIPSIIVCDKTKVIIDGHHRYNALVELGVQYCPITLVNYEDRRIVTRIDGIPLSKEAVIEAALKGPYLAPKTSAHHFLDDQSHFRPLLILSYLFDLGIVI